MIEDRKEKKRESQRIYRKKNLKKLIEYDRNRNRKVRKEILELLGNECANPYSINHGGFLSDSRCLQIDHVNGKGKQELLKFKNPNTYYFHILRKIREGSKDYQLLCANCNWIKRIEEREL